MKRHYKYNLQPMKLITVISELICPALSQQRIQINNLQQTLQILTEHKNEIAAKEKMLRNELQFIYSILIHRCRCRFRLFPMVQQSFLLLAVSHTFNQVNFFLYIPNQQSNEIAQAYANVKDNTLVIHELYVSPSHSNPQIHSFLLLQIKSEAKTLGLSVIYAYQPDAV
jgi:hypothetical protein